MLGKLTTAVLTALRSARSRHLSIPAHHGIKQGLLLGGGVFSIQVGPLLCWDAEHTSEGLQENSRARFRYCFKMCLFLQF